MANLNTFMTFICCALLQGCVSTSLQDAAPQRDVTNNSPTALGEPFSNTASADSLVNQNSGVLQNELGNTQTSDKFDEQGFPTFVETPRGEVGQLSSAEKIAIETKLTELLLKRESDENVRAGFEAKLKRLRKLAKTHEQNADAIISQ